MVLPRLIVAVKKGASGEIYGNDATARTMWRRTYTYIYVYIIPIHRIYMHTRAYIGLVESRLIAADSHEIIGRERYISVIFSTPTLLWSPIKRASGYHGRTDDVFTILPVFTRC